MFRVIATVVVGYFVMTAMVIATSGVNWAVLGADGAFEPGSTTASLAWSLLSCFFGLVAAVCAGWVASRIDRHPRHLGTKALVALVLILGAGFAMTAMSAPVLPLPEGKTVADLTFMEAGQIARNPSWYLIVIPVIGVLGIVLGSGLWRTPSETV